MRQPVPATLTSAMVLGALLMAPAAQAVPNAPFTTAAIRAAAGELATGSALRIVSIPLSRNGQEMFQDLELERFEVFGPSARIVLHGASGDRLVQLPRNVYLRGRIAGDPRSRAVVSVLESGEIRGLVTRDRRIWLFGATPGEAPLRARELEPLQSRGEFHCDLDQLGAAAFRAGDDAEADALAALLSPGPLAGAIEQPLAFDHTAVIAIETDSEFLDLPAFAGDPTAAANYIADLTAFGSAIYTREVQTSWQLGEISLWQDADLYSQTGACGLLELGAVWNVPPNSLIPRTTVHFLSGKNSNSGIAWVGVLCGAAFTTSPASLGTTCAAPVSGTGLYGGAYGFTAGIDGDFNLDNPNVVWDIVAYTHEIGHNFNSPHTHCYQNIGGIAAPVDTCFSGQCGSTACYCGVPSLPLGCPGFGQGCGTIMSYCHLLSGGLGDISLTLGLGHPYGTAPERVPQRMRDFVVQQAAANPACLAPQGPTAEIFSDGFESGNISAWQ